MRKAKRVTKAQLQNLMEILQFKYMAARSWQFRYRGQIQSAERAEAVAKDAGKLVIESMHRLGEKLEMERKYYKEEIRESKRAMQALLDARWSDIQDLWKQREDLRAELAANRKGNVVPIKKSA